MLRQITPPVKVKLELRINPKQKIEAAKDLRSVMGCDLNVAAVLIESLIASKVESLVLEFNVDQVPDDVRTESNGYV